MRVLGLEINDAGIMAAEARSGKLLKVDGESLATELLATTGSDRYVQQLKKSAKQKGFQLTSTGLFKDGQRITARSEEDVYEKLGAEYRPPEARETWILEDEGEPAESFDYKGDWHVHSNFSDGFSSLAEMAFVAGGMGLDYLVITDHIGEGKQGLDEAALEDRNAALDKVAQSSKVALMKGGEVSIGSRGELMATSGCLDQLEVVVAAVHTHLSMDKKEMTSRVLKAMESEEVDVLAHPTSRIIGLRDPIRLDMAKIGDKAAEMGIALEINAHPDRLDLSEEAVHSLKDSGAVFCIGSDAHSSEGLMNWRWAEPIVRRAFLPTERILNRLGLEDACKKWRRMG
jgi:DNA polymerase (family 10)